MLRGLLLLSFLLPRPHHFEGGHGVGLPLLLLTTEEEGKNSLFTPRLFSENPPVAPIQL